MKSFLFLLTLLLANTLAYTAEPTEFEVGGFHFKRPADWKWIQPTSPMRKAELQVPSPAGNADITFFHFGSGQGGGVQANIQRWLSQFKEPVEQLKAQTAVHQVGTTKITFLQAYGTFLSGMPGQPSTPQAGYAMRGAILESSDGDVYVKMTGPATAVDAAGAAFDAMITGCLPKAP